MWCSNYIFHRYWKRYPRLVVISSENDWIKCTSSTQSHDKLLPMLPNSSCAYVRKFFTYFATSKHDCIPYSFFRLLKCAEEHHLPKRLNSEFGGGLKEFVKSEENKFEGFENEIEFFTMQERQWLILRLLESLRFRAGDESSNLKCIEGQVISKLYFLCSRKNV